MQFCTCVYACLHPDTQTLLLSVSAQVYLYRLTRIQRTHTHTHTDCPTPLTSTQPSAVSCRRTGGCCPLGALSGEGLCRAPLTGTPPAPPHPPPAPRPPLPSFPPPRRGRRSRHTDPGRQPPRRWGEDFAVGGGLVVVSLLVLYSSLLQPVRSRPAASPARATLPRPPCSEHARM